MRIAPSLFLALALLGCGKLVRVERAAFGRPPGARTVADSLAAMERDSAAAAEVQAALRAYYGRFTARDWLMFSQSFWRGAIITTRWTPPGEPAERVYTVTVDEFVRRAPEGPDRLAVFSEEPVRMDVVTYGPLASAWVVYRARFGATRDSVETHYGIDAFHLMQHRGEWRIAGLTFANEAPGRPLVVRR